MPRLQINPEDFKRAKIVKPGWYPTIIKDVNLEPNSKRDGENIVLDVENADNKSEFLGVTAKVWFTEKFPQGSVNFVKAFFPNTDETQVADVEFEEFRGRYIFAKWGTFRGKDGGDQPNNRIDDWAPLPKQWAHLANINATDNAATSGIGFDRTPESVGAGAGVTDSVVDKKAKK